MQLEMQSNPQVEIFGKMEIEHLSDNTAGIIANNCVTWSDHEFPLQSDEICRGTKVWKLNLI